MVLAHWFWNWLINARDARLITGHYQIPISKPRRPISSSNGSRHSPNEHGPIQDNPMGCRFIRSHED